MRALARCFAQTLGRIVGEKETLVLLFGASFFYALFYPTPYMKQVLRDLPVIVVDRDHTALSRQITRWLELNAATHHGPGPFYDTEAPFQGYRRSTRVRPSLPRPSASAAARGARC